jgi:hypothetical protein
MASRNTRVLTIYIFEEATFFRTVKSQWNIRLSYNLYEYTSKTNLWYPDYLTCFKTQGEYDV